MSNTELYKIPNLYHFIWMGPSKPYFLMVAIQSVLLRCKGAQVILWVDREDDNSTELEQLKKNKRFSIRKIDINHFADQLENGIVKEVIRENFDIVGTKSNTAKKQPSRPVERSRSNLLRYLILYLYGGIYLDADTIVLKDMSPLLQQSSGFIGKENAAWPIHKREQAFHRFFWGPILEVVRFTAIKLPFGYKFNGLYRYLCSASENNAVLGFCPRHNYLYECFKYVVGMPKEEILKSLRLGPFLLQRVSKQYHHRDLITYPEDYFYPYGPLISEHFFKPRGNAEYVKNHMVDTTTHVIHWGASSKLLSDYTKENFAKQGNRSVFTLLENDVISTYDQQFSGNSNN